MISFIIIGRNEGWRLAKCISSIKETIRKNHLNFYEIIYVDSNSEDDSINVALSFSPNIIIKLTGDYNAAIARNIGANVSRGDVLFFIDGDMELIHSSFKHLFIEGEIKYPFISGDFINQYYNNDTFQLKRYYNNKTTKRSFTTGGLFLIKKKLWISVNGMRNEFRRSQDFDLGLRLAKNGYFLYRLPIILAKHHTISYENKFRKWKMLLDKTHLWGRCYLYRRNVFNIWCWRLFIRQDYSLLLLIFILLAFFITNNLLVFILYLVVLLIRSFRNNIKSLFYVPEDIVYFLIRDIFQILGFVFFHPNRKKNIQYQIL